MCKMVHAISNFIMHKTKVTVKKQKIIKMKKLVFSLLAVLILTACGSKPAETKLARCYHGHVGDSDSVFTVESQGSGVVKGAMAFVFAQKDSSHGTYEGTFVDGVLKAKYLFWSEGVESVPGGAGFQAPLLRSALRAAVSLCAWRAAPEYLGVRAARKHHKWRSPRRRWCMPCADSCVACGFCARRHKVPILFIARIAKNFYLFVEIVARVR